MENKNFEKKKFAKVHNFQLCCIPYVRLRRHLRSCLAVLKESRGILAFSLLRLSGQLPVFFFCSAVDSCLPGQLPVLVFSNCLDSPLPWSSPTVWTDCCPGLLQLSGQPAVRSDAFPCPAVCFALVVWYPVNTVVWSKITLLLTRVRSAARSVSSRP